MSLFRIIIFSYLLMVFVPVVSGDTKKAKAPKAVRDPDLIFDFEENGALFGTVSGVWRYFDDDGKRMIRLSPEPILDGRVELGASLPSYDVIISAMVLGKSKGRLAPRMGVGLFGQYGFCLRMVPGSERLELVQYGEVIAEVPLEWEETQWYHIELSIQGRQSHWEIAGRVWAEGGTRPEKPGLAYQAFPSTLTHKLTGRAFLAGAPFSGFPIFYDKVVVRKLIADKDDREKN